MLLILSSTKPWNSEYFHPNGHILYKVVCPWSLFHRKATVMKVVRSAGRKFTQFALRPALMLAFTDNLFSVDGSLQDRFGTIAEIEFHNTTSSRITFVGQGTYDTNSFFRRGGFSLSGR
ncbi:hypothetical protein CC2G_006554 [Coprinopsis cinerea AmutBmut pab1-1]|nr:hypothetical protein CC2G_006554 [Coprinopsis cinerea AmutBmut pab1-1]